MIDEIKNNIETALKDYALSLGRMYKLRGISPVLEASLKNFLLRKGKRLRPILFIISYLGYAKKKAPGLYKSAISLELLHSFLLIHDDIIDKSPLRKGQPAMHVELDNFLNERGRLKFNGSDLSIIIGDIIFSLAGNLFLSIDEKKANKEKAVKNFNEIVTYTGAGQFIEILNGIKSVKETTIRDIYKIYDLKTAYYTFSAPLTLGAMLSGAGSSETAVLFRYGIYAGRAFQIKDDILDMFASCEETGKSAYTDIKESKKTILIAIAYKKSKSAQRKAIQKILTKNRINKTDCRRIREIIRACGALKSARRLINTYTRKAKKIGSTLKMKEPYKDLLLNYTQRLLGNKKLSAYL